MKYFVLLCLISSNAYAVDFGKYINLMKTEMNRLFGEEGKSGGEDFPMPKIPTVIQDAISTDVYKKTGTLHTQGLSFIKLSSEAKRKYRIAFVRELYQVVRGAEAKNSELSTGLNILEQDGTREGVYRSLVLSNDYRTLENYEEVPSEKLINWSMAYAEKFLGLSYKKEQVSKLNLWGIKRVLVEKTLEVMDSFPTDGEDLYKWYAHLSFDLSSHPKVTWKNKTRKIRGLEYHRLWAKKVPFQHIKSEVIIKLHKVFNSLM